MQKSEGGITLLVVDQNKIFAEILTHMLSQTGEFSTAIAGSLVEIDEASQKMRFDLVLVDYTMPGLNQITAVEELINRLGGARLVLFSLDLDLATVRRAVDIGVAGYIPKTTSLGSIVAILRLISAGEMYLPVHFIGRKWSDAVPEAASMLNLDQTDLDVLRVLQEGQSNKEIGRKIGVTEVKVKMILRSIYTKLNARNRTQVITIARELELI